MSGDNRIHERVEDDLGLLGCAAVQPDRHLPTFQMNCSGCHIAEDSVPHFGVIVKLVFVLCFMIPGNNDALTSFVECVVLCNSQSRVGDQYLFVKHALFDTSPVLILETTGFKLCACSITVEELLSKNL